MILMNHQYITEHPQLFRKVTLQTERRSYNRIYTFLLTEFHDSKGMYFVENDPLTVWFQRDQDLTYFLLHWNEQQTTQKRAA